MKEAIELGTTSVHSHLQKKPFNEEGVYYPMRQVTQNDDETTAVIRSRQLYIYRNGKKVLVLPDKAVPEITREDSPNELLSKNLLK